MDLSKVPLEELVEELLSRPDLDITKVSKGVYQMCVLGRKPPEQRLAYLQFRRQVRRQQ